ncbi:MAG: hypothetical protein JXO22_14620 [Phycisphaerae bacterium]|nr:hypothetical protein [Phycisphaerae bacterium]
MALHAQIDDRTANGVTEAVRFPKNAPCRKGQVGGVIAEIDGGTSVPPVEMAMRTYAWGLDLAGQRDPSRDREGVVGTGMTAAQASLERTGGIGGLQGRDTAEGGCGTFVRPALEGFA